MGELSAGFHFQAECDLTEEPRGKFEKALKVF